MIPITQQSCLTVSRSGPVIAGWCVWLESKERLWNSALPFAAKPTMLNAINPELISTTLNGKLVWIPNYTGYDWGGKSWGREISQKKNVRYSSKSPRIDFTSFRNICVYTHYSTRKQSRGKQAPLWSFVKQLKIHYIPILSHDRAIHSAVITCCGKLPNLHKHENRALLIFTWPGTQQLKATRG